MYKKEEKKDLPDSLWSFTVLQEDLTFSFGEQGTEPERERMVDGATPGRGQSLGLNLNPKLLVVFHLCFNLCALGSMIPLMWSFLLDPE